MTVLSTSSEVEMLHQEGFVLLRGAVDPDVVTRLDEATQNLTSADVDSPTHASFNANPALLQLRDAANRVSSYQLLFGSERLMAVVRGALNGSVQVIGTEILKRSTYDQAHEPWHRDSGQYLERTYDDLNGPLHLKAQVFFTDTTAENSGNLVLIPGSHRWPPGARPAQFWQDADRALSRGDLPDDAVVVRAAPGDAVVFGNTLWHSVLPNLTQERRSAIIRFGQAWLRPYDHHPLPETAADHLDPDSRRLMGYHPAGSNPIDLYKEGTSNAGADR